MKLRNAGLLVVLLAAAGACKKTEHHETQAGSASIAQGSGSAGVATDPWSKPKAAKDPLAKPLFWSLEKDGKTDYILGTMHTGVDPESRLPDVVWKKLDESKTFAMETDLSDAPKLDVLRHAGTTLERERGADSGKKLEDALGAKDASRLRGFKP